MSNKREAVDAFDASMWVYRAEQYEQLGWVGDRGLIEQMIDCCALREDPGGLLVDVGAGKGAVAQGLSSYVDRVVAFDYSAEMVKGLRAVCEGVFQASSEYMPIQSGIARTMTTRMVLHHLTEEQIKKTALEAYRILDVGGRWVVCEYVAADEEVKIFERAVFDKKEPGRHLWTGEELRGLVQESLADLPMRLNVVYSVLPQYSVVDWMKKSGLSESIQAQVLRDYLTCPESIMQKMGIAVSNEVALVDRLFAFVVAEKLE